LKIFPKCVEKIQVSLKSDTHKGTLHEDQFDVFLTVHHSIDLFQVTKLMHTSFVL